MLPRQIDNLILNLADAEFVQRPQGQVAYATQAAHQAKDQLVALGAAAIPAVLNCLNGRYPAHQRAMAAQVLGDIGDRQAVSALINKLRDPEMLVRGFSAEALGKIGDRRAVGSLRAMLKNDKEAEMVKSYAQGALNRIGYAEKRSDTIGIWKGVFWLGVIVLLISAFVIVISLSVLSGPYAAGRDWVTTIGIIAISLGLGSLLIYTATRPIKPGELDQRLHTKKLWKAIFIIGLLMLLFGLLMGITGLTSSDFKETRSGWLFALICGLPPILLGWLATFLATRPAKK